MKNKLRPCITDISKLIRVILHTNHIFLRSSDTPWFSRHPARNTLLLHTLYCPMYVYLSLSLGLCSSVLMWPILFVYFYFLPSLCIINYYQLIFVYVMQRNRFLAFPWVLWSLFELLFTLGTTIFLLAIWNGVSFLQLVNYWIKSTFSWLKYECI